jgi:parvulin-like peptidyl-prolyl isomerase
MKRHRWLVLLPVAGLVLGYPHFAAKRSEQPDVVVVQHILIGFKKTVPGKKLERTKKEAAALAQELLERAQAGEDFGAMVEEYTNDRPPGIMKVTNKDAPLMANSVTRNDVVTYFGDVAFNLKIGEIALAKYHPGNSPFGWHVIKRLE